MKIKLCLSAEIGKKSRAHLFLFAKSGFTQGCTDAAAALGNVSLVTYQEIAEKLTE